ncbi:PID-CTERM protein-sorting domain-containing protein [Hymenobacter jeongseonensis]|uniref:PID-CTERM protein-sorting domain-containing protein n=1 Tax=Hymenobacter jeongseonensis TaxID=2791027 RepID=UPI0037428E75
MNAFLTSATRLLAMCLLTSLPALSQPDTGGPLAPTAVPIDGGASLLLAGGLAFGLRQLRARRARQPKS